MRLWNLISHLSLWSHERMNEKEEQRRSRSAEVGEVALPAAHLTAHCGQHVVISSGQLGAQTAAAAAAEALQAALLPCGQSWKNKISFTIRKKFNIIIIIYQFVATVSSSVNKEQMFSDQSFVIHVHVSI